MLGDGSDTEWSKWQTAAVRRHSLLSLDEIFWQLGTKLSTGQEENTDEFSWAWKKGTSLTQNQPTWPDFKLFYKYEQDRGLFKSSVLILEKIISFWVFTLEKPEILLNSGKAIWNTDSQALQKVSSWGRNKAQKISA